MYGSSTRSIERRVGELRPGSRSRAPRRRPSTTRVAHGRRGDDQVEVVLALEPLLDDLAVQEAEEAAAEAEAERGARLGLVAERRVVEPELLERGLQVLVVLGVHRVEPAEHHRLHLAEAGQRPRRAAARGRDRVADPDLVEALDARRSRCPPRRAESDSTRRGWGSITWRSSTSCSLPCAMSLMRWRARDACPSTTRTSAATPTYGVEPGVEDQRAQRRAPGRPAAAARRCTMRSRSSRMPVPSFAETGRTLGGVEPEHVLDLLRGARPGRRSGRSILFTTGISVEVRVDREVGVRERLRLDALRRVHDEDRALAGLERPRDLVGEVDVAGRVDQVQHVLAAVVGHEAHARGLGLDRDAALALEVHLVEELVALLAVGERVRGVEQPIGQRALAVVDVRDDAEVADPRGGRSSRAPRGASRASASREPVARAREAVLDRDARLPAELALRERGVGAAHLRVVGRERPERDLARAPVTRRIVRASSSTDTSAWLPTFTGPT